MVKKTEVGDAELTGTLWRSKKVVLRTTPLCMTHFQTYHVEEFHMGYRTIVVLAKDLIHLVGDELQHYAELVNIIVETPVFTMKKILCGKMLCDILHQNQ